MSNDAVHADNLRTCGLDLKIDDELTELPSCHISEAGQSPKHVWHNTSSVYRQTYVFACVASSKHTLGLASPMQREQADNQPFNSTDVK